MIEILKQSLETLESSPEFKKWKKENKDSYLCSFFIISESGENLNNWQIDFFNKRNRRITSFLIHPITINPSEEVFQKEKKVVKELHPDTIKVDLEEALEVVQNLLHTKYKSEHPNKFIIVLQCLTTLVWNITLLTTSFNIINIKIDATTKEIVDEKSDSVLKFRS